MHQIQVNNIAYNYIPLAVFQPWAEIMNHALQEDEGLADDEMERIVCIRNRHSCGRHAGVQHVQPLCQTSYYILGHCTWSLQLCNTVFPWKRCKETCDGKKAKATYSTFYNLVHNQKKFNRNCHQVIILFLVYIEL